MNSIRPFLIVQTLPALLFLAGCAAGPDSTENDPLGNVIEYQMSHPPGHDPLGDIIEHQMSK